MRGPDPLPNFALPSAIRRLSTINPVTDVSSQDIVCGPDAQVGQMTFPVSPGDGLQFFVSPWLSQLPSSMLFPFHLTLTSFCFLETSGTGFSMLTATALTGPTRLARSSPTSLLAKGPASRSIPKALLGTKWTSRAKLLITLRNGLNLALVSCRHATCMLLTDMVLMNHVVERS